MIWDEYKAALLEEMKLERLRQIEFLQQMDRSLLRFVHDNCEKITVLENGEIKALEVQFRRAKKKIAQGKISLARSGFRE